MMQLKPLKSTQKPQLDTLDIAAWIPHQDRIKSLDVAPWLFQSLLLKEKDFREAVKNHDWDQYKDCLVHVYCSTDAIMAPWAYMLVASALDSIADFYTYGSEKELIKEYLFKVMESYDWSAYKDRIVLVKGCGDKRITHAFYVKATHYLRSYAKRINYGEACSFVPVYKQASTKVQPGE